MKNRVATKAKIDHSKFSIDSRGELFKGGSILSTDVKLKYLDDTRLTDIAITTTAYSEAGDKVQKDKFWSTWDPNETKIIINLPTTKIERFEVVGTAKSGGKEVYWELFSKSR